MFTFMFMFMFMSMFMFMFMFTFMFVVVTKITFVIAFGFMLVPNFATLGRAGHTRYILKLLLLQTASENAKTKTTTKWPTQLSNLNTISL